MILAPGTTSYSLDVQILDDSGLAVTGLVAATFPSVSYSLGSNVAASSISLSDLAAITTAYSSGGVKERSGGFYRLDLPNAAITSTGSTVQLIGEATGKHLIAPKIQVAYVGANTIQLAGQTVTAAAGVTFPSAIASPTNITAGTITTTTNTVAINGYTIGTSSLSGLDSVGHDYNLGGLIVATNNDKTGYALSTSSLAAVATYVWTATTRALDATSITSLVSSIAAGVWGATTRTLSAFGFTVALPTTPPAGYGGFSFSGARAVTITVHLADGTTPAPSAVVRVTQGASSQPLQTNSSGQATFSLDDGAYTLAITKGGYSFTPATIPVDATHTSFSATLTANTYTPATDPSQSRCYLVCYDPQGNPDPAAKVTIQLAAPGTSGAWTNNLMVAGCDETGTIVDPADGNSGVRHALGIAYKARRGDGPISPDTRWVNYTPDTPVFQMPAMIGRDPASAACFGQG